mgnify:CR=1 FL=1
MVIRDLNSSAEPNKWGQTKVVIVGCGFGTLEYETAGMCRLLSVPSLLKSKTIFFTHYYWLDPNMTRFVSVRRQLPNSPQGTSRWFPPFSAGVSTKKWFARPPLARGATTPNRTILQSLPLAHPKAFVILARAQKGKVSDHDIKGSTVIDNWIHHFFLVCNTIVLFDGHPLFLPANMWSVGGESSS